MSKWSSFERDKEFADGWRKFLNEESSVQEGVFDRLGSAGQSVADFFTGKPKDFDPKMPSPSRKKEPPKQDDDAVKSPEPETHVARNIKINFSSKHGKATTIEDIALQMLGLPAVPDPNKNKAANRALGTLSVKLVNAVEKGLRDQFGSSVGKVEKIMEEKELLYKIIQEEFARVLNEKK